jgi:hypothetical protein
MLEQLAWLYNFDRTNSRCPFISHQNSWQAHIFNRLFALQSADRWIRSKVMSIWHQTEMSTSTAHIVFGLLLQQGCKNFYARRQRTNEGKTTCVTHKVKTVKETTIASILWISACSWLVVRRPVTFRVATKSSVVCLAQPVDAGVQLDGLKRETERTE